MSMMNTYKPGQGRQARTLAALLAILVTAWGAYSFLDYGNSKLDRLMGFEKPIFSKPFSFIDSGSGLTDFVTPSLALSLGLFIVFFFVIRRILNRPKVADHLIGTELEMRRVKWPTKTEVMRAGSMVVYYVFWLALIIFIIDLYMATVVNGLILGHGTALDNTGLGSPIAGMLEMFMPEEKAKSVFPWVFWVIFCSLHVVAVMFYQATQGNGKARSSQDADESDAE